MNVRDTAVRALAAAALALAASPALAVYTDRTAFLGAVALADPAARIGDDGFDDLTDGAGLGSNEVTRNAGGIGYRASSGDDLYAGADGFLTNGGSEYDIVLDAFARGVFAAGADFFGSDVLGAFAEGARLTIVALDLAGASLEVDLTDALRTSFAGFVSDTGLVSLTLTLTEPTAGYPSLDNLTLAQHAVPAPGTLALALAGLGVAAAVRRRR